MTIKELIEKLKTESDKKVKEGEKANGNPRIVRVLVQKYVEL